MGEAGGKAGAGGGLADAALAGCDDDDSGHSSLWVSYGKVIQAYLSRQCGDIKYLFVCVFFQADGGPAGATARCWYECLEGAVHARDRNQFGFEAGGEDARLRVALAPASARPRSGA
jgi:hypothetical protein